MLKQQPQVLSPVKLIIVTVLVIANALLGFMAWRVTNKAVAVLPTISILPSGTATEPQTPSPTSTQTRLPSLTPSATWTSSATATEPATATPTASVMPTNTPTITAMATQTQTSTTVPIQIKIRAGGTQARSGPGITYDIVSQSAANTVYMVRAYGKDYFGYVWYLVDLPDGQSGWILGPAADVSSGSNLVSQVPMAGTIPPTPTLNPTITLTPAQSDLEAQLQAVPVFSGIGPQLEKIYRTGQERGNRTDAFSKIGDCNTKSDAFLRPIDQGRYRLGRYAFLQDTIRQFKGSFGRDSIAGQVGFNVATAQDSFWADPKYCKAIESPIDCEYRLMQPSVAIIMFGANDILSFSPEVYGKYMARIIEKSLSNGIIPVLMTITWHDYGSLYTKMLEFNLMDVSLAQQYHIPLINFWLAAQYLPGHGIIADNAHLSWSPNGLDFTGEQSQWGETLRSLLALEMLNDIEKKINNVL